MLPPGLETAQQVKQHYDELYLSLIDSGTYQPFLISWFLAPYILVIVYLLIDHRSSRFLRLLRFPLFACVTVSAAWSIANVRGRSPAAAYGVGLTNMWGWLWVASIMMLNDSQRDFQRIERRPEEAKPAPPAGCKPSAASAAQPPAFYWQAFPSQPFSARVSWVLDLFCSFRGVGWTFQTAGIPPAPKFVEDSLRGTQEAATSSASAPGPATASSPIPPYSVSPLGRRRYTTRAALARAIIPPIIFKIILLDFIKLPMRHDTYFFGYGSVGSQPAPAYFPSLLHTSPILLKSYRLALTLLAIHTILTLTFYNGALVFSLLLGSHPITRHLMGLRSEAWMNPPSFFSASLEPVFTHGIPGFWGGFWHQVFRFGFEAPCTALLQTLHWPKRSTPARILALTCAFSLSGLLHAAGSHTQLGATRPWTRAWAFFALQGAAALAQALCVQALTRHGILARLPMPLKRGANFALTFLNLYFVAPLLVDDFAQGGAWLFEPLPVSALMALGCGKPGDESPWTLWRHLITWRQGDRWWRTGWAG